MATRGVGAMAMQTPIQPSDPWTAPTSDAAAGQWAAPPPQAVKRGWPVWARILLGLAVMLAAWAVVAAVLAGGGEDTAVVNTHTAEAGEPALVSVPRYAYENLTGDDLAYWQDEMLPALKSVNEEIKLAFPDLGDYYLSWSSHKVVAADGDVGAAFLVSVNPEYLDAGILTEDDVVLGMAGGAAGGGATVTTETIAGEKVVYDVGDDVHSFSWFHDGVMTTASGTDEGDTRDFVEAYLEAAHE